VFEVVGYFDVFLPGDPKYYAAGFSTLGLNFYGLPLAYFILDIQTNKRNLKMFKK